MKMAFAFIFICLQQIQCRLQMRMGVVSVCRPPRRNFITFVLCEKEKSFTSIAITTTTINPKITSMMANSIKLQSCKDMMMPLLMNYCHKQLDVSDMHIIQTNNQLTTPDHTQTHSINTNQHDFVFFFYDTFFAQATRAHTWPKIFVYNASAHIYYSTIMSNYVLTGGQFCWSFYFCLYLFFYWNF